MMWQMVVCASAVRLVGSLLASLALALAVLRLRVVVCLWRRRTTFTGDQAKRTLAFLHPYANDGGGGERVLWVAIREAVARGVADPTYWRVVVYTGDSASDADIRAHAAARFGVHVPEHVEFVRLSLRGWIEPKRYPVATLLGQALGSMILAAEAVACDPPDVLLDTTGLHFCLPLLRLLGVPRLVCYVHYPLVSADMLRVVAARKAAHNNAAVFARSAVGAALKYTYYRVLIGLYRRAGRCSDAVLANGSWTARHLRELWGVKPALVFPPCDTRQLQALPLHPPPFVPTAATAVLAATLPPAALQREGGGRGRLVLSVAQFRPEKDHAMQIRAFARLLQAWQASGAPAPRPTLVLAGAVRHDADRARLEALRALAAKLLQDTEASHVAAADAHGAGRSGALDGAILFAPNLSMGELHALFGRAAVGLHTMWNEHFGIGVVEMLAAGVATIAHRSGGPAEDIIADGDGSVGLLASDDTEYADAMEALLLAPGADARRAAMGAAGRASVSARFSEEAFGDALCAALRLVVCDA